MIRALVVDDDDGKARVLSRALEDAGVRPQDIDCCNSLVAARRALSSSVFDVMLLDVLLPLRKDGVPSGTNSVELLREIYDDGSLNAPKYIVGVSAEALAVQGYADEFRKMTLHVLHVAPGEESWRTFVRQLIVFVGRAKESQDSYDVDVCVLNALRDPELEAVISRWPASIGEESLLDHSVLYREGTCPIAGKDRRVVFAHPAQMGLVAATHAATSLLNAFRPSVLLMTGICGGFADHVRVGDVVVAEKSWDWQAGKWSEGGELLGAPDQRMGSALLVARARTIDSNRLQHLASTFAGAVPEDVPRLVLGPMVSGSSVVASTDIQKVFRVQHRKMVAVDMECFGVYYAASVASTPETKVLCVKAVSDLADRHKGDNFQRYCSHLSAAVGFEVIERYFAGVDD